MPRPISIVTHDDVRARCCPAWNVDEQQRTTRVTSSRPAATTILLPNRCTHTLRQRGEDHQHAACGSSTAPAFDRRVAEHRLQVLRQQEQRAEQREEHERDRAARGAEPRVLEEVHVEHRVASSAAPTRRTRRAARRRRRSRRGSSGEPQPWLGRLDDRPQERAERDDRQHRADRVERGVRRVAATRARGSSRARGRRSRSARSR